MPIAYTQATADEICRRIALGEPLKPICREKGMPCWWTVYQWIKNRPPFAAAMEEARKLGARALAEQALEIADTPMLGEEITINEDGTRTVKTKLELEGDKENPLTVTVTRLTDKAKD
jgi:hypothetical protein